jgi:hypothetical protein
MEKEHREFELWREQDWRCEWWSVGGEQQVRLYLGPYKVNELIAGPDVDVHRQMDEWRCAAHADCQRTQTAVVGA